MKRFYHWLLEKSRHPHAFWYLGGISFTESFISFIPPDPLLGPMIVAEPKRAYGLAAWSTFTSVLGGFIGYAIGFFLFKKFGLPILETYGLTEKMSAFQAMFHKWGFWAILLKAFTPIPFKLVTITSGVVHFNFWLFAAACTLSRGLRFFLEAVLLKHCGKALHDLMERYLMVIALLFLGLLVFGFFIVKYIG